MAQDIRQADLLRLSGVLELCARLSSCPADELDFVLLNETSALLRYSQMALYDTIPGCAKGVSGVAVFESSAPYVCWLDAVFKHMAGTQDTPRALSPADLPQALAEQWPQWLAASAVLLPLTCRQGSKGLVLVARDDAWSAAEVRLLAIICNAYAQARVLAAMPRAPVSPHHTRRKWIIGAGAFALALALFPVHSWVLAPAEVVAVDPVYIRAPYAGIVRQINVPPNGTITAGTSVVELERGELESQYQVASKAWQVARTEYDEAVQAGISDPKARAQAAQLRGRIDEQVAQMRYQAEQLQKTSIPALITGLALYNDPSEWVGRPVEAGERILMVAPALSNRIEIHLPVTEIGHFETGSAVRFFDNVHPDQPVDGHLIFASYSASLTPTATLAYTLRADMAQNMRMGLNGTARIYGPRHMLIAWALRKPLGVLRQWIAF
ncbi:MAG: HlyD family secretion protein [Acetobacter sp.]